MGAFREQARCEKFLQPEDHQIVSAGQVDEFVERSLRFLNDLSPRDTGDFAGGVKVHDRLGDPTLGVA